ncbi:MAG TPA: zinc ABC transporter substrate-binding protein, partial [Clostridiales bacterium]|nr:zinc ABC transporter substrate-binding protein [Clostridiales bacterium]
NENYNKDILITIENNAANYIEEVNVINDEINKLKQYNSKGVIIFHDSFAYIANKVGIPIIKMIELEHDTSLSSGEVANIINLIKENDIKIIFSEAQFSDNIPSKIALETDAKVFIIDSAVSGDGNIDSYLKSMGYNIKTIKEALEYEKDN